MQGGFLRPVQLAPLTPEQEAGIAAACPGLSQTVEAEGRTDSSLWGPYLAMRTGWACDPDLRRAGSSGGVLSALAAWLLASGQVDAVIATAADPANPTGNAEIVATDADTVKQAAGSRYAPSSPLARLADHLSEHRATGRRFALIGKPCDISALRVMQAREPDLRRAIPVALSFFCAGVPNAAGGRAVLDALGVDPATVDSFRYRGMGWPGRATARMADGSERSMSYHDSWGGILSKHGQHRCRICADAVGMAADITCADAWESDAGGYPVFDEAPGISLVVARTPFGAQLMAQAEAAGAIATADFAVDSLAAIQPGQRNRKRALLARLLALRLAGRPVPRYVGLQLFAAARQAPLGSHVRNALGIFRRLLQRRI